MTDNKKLVIKERRRQLASLLARDSNLSQVQLAKALGVEQSTISNDIQYLKQEAERFIFDLAKGELCFHYKQSIDGIEEAKREAWRIYNQQSGNDFYNGTRLKLLALKIVIQANEAKFKLISEGPTVMAMKAMEERLRNVEAAATVIRQGTV